MSEELSEELAGIKNEQEGSGVEALSVLAEAADLCCREWRGLRASLVYTGPF